MYKSIPGEPEKKIIITFTICLFAVGSIFNMHMAQNDQNMDISLADISVMAQASGDDDRLDIYSIDSLINSETLPPANWGSCLLD
jgi:hypothetical protein